MFDVLERAILRLHQAIYVGSGGLIGHRLIGLPTLLLRTTGRRTGAPRTAALVYAKDGNRYVVVASNGGADRSPGWSLNAEAHPEVDVQTRRHRAKATAELIAKGDASYERLWELVNRHAHHRYDSYQRKTSRPIPLLVLTPQEDVPSSVELRWRPGDAQAATS